MISVILYGRNDSYGYNLHKRAALSLNCIAAVLDGPDDEILFVDYNTPDDFPTFPEAIQDTLTQRARTLLRVLRVRPRHHARFAARSHLQALEPVARNVALRRSNPANRWVLSTNTDMIFVPRGPASLSAVASTLADGFYGLPRFEIPESLWESLDRLDPTATIAQVGAWGGDFHLNEIVTLDEPAVRFDGPGDFQLMLRHDLSAVHGFDERMLLGWHVDSNIAVRLARRHGPVRDILDAFYGYHCDHTRQVTPAHRPGAAQNDWRRFVTAVADEVAPDQPDWGMADAEIEEIRLDEQLAAHRNALAAAVPRAMTTPSHAAFGAATFGRTDYDAAHVAPFVIDALCCQPPGTRLGWFATRADLLARVAASWPVMGFSRSVQVAVHDALPQAALPPGAVATDTAEIAGDADVLVFDFALTDALRNGTTLAMDDDPAVAAVLGAFRACVAAEQQRSAAGMPLRRFIAVNAINNPIERIVTARIGAPMSPFAARLRQGFMVRPPPPPFTEASAPRDLLPDITLHPAGRRDGNGIAIAGDGVVFEGPFLALAPGTYRYTVTMDPTAAGMAVLEVTSGDRRLAARAISVAPEKLVRGMLLAVVFTVRTDQAPGGTMPELSFRLFAQDHLEGRIAAATLRAALPGDRPPGDITGLLVAGPAGRDRADGVAAGGVAGLVFETEHQVPPGKYRFVADYRPAPGRLPRPGVVLLQADHGARLLARRHVLLYGLTAQRISMVFEAPLAGGAVVLRGQGTSLLRGLFTSATLHAMNAQRDLPTPTPTAPASAPGHGAGPATLEPER